MRFYLRVVFIVLSFFVFVGNLIAFYSNRTTSSHFNRPDLCGARVDWNDGKFARVLDR